MGRIRGVSVTGLLVVLVCCSPMLFSVFYPVVATSGGPADAGAPPRECVTAPDRTGAGESEATVGGTVASSGDGTVNITYDVEPGTDAALTVAPTGGIEVVDTGGFDAVDSGFFGSSTDESPSQLRANRSANAHWIEYRPAAITAGESERNPYPNGDEWLIAPIPEHTDAAVSLEPAGSGYVGSSTLYLGSFDRESTTVGCQTFEVIVPADVGSSFDADERLADLESAARGIPGRKYETVHVFVSPGELGEERPLGGFVRDRSNEIVVDADLESFPSSFVWIHEYVHTLQDYRPQSDLAWTVEGVATYTALETAVDAGRITPLEYDLTLSRLKRADPDDGPLVNGSSELTPYSRGTAVIARMDADLEAESERSITDVVEWLNTYPEPGYVELKAYLTDEAGLPAETVDGYDRFVLEDDPVPVEYRHAPTELSPAAWTVVSLLLTDVVRAASAVGLTGVAATLLVRVTYRRLKLDSDEIEF